MKLEKKHWIIIGVVVAIILVWYFFLRKKKNTESDYRMVRRPRRVVSSSTIVAPGPVSATSSSVVFSTPLDFLSKTPKCPPGCTFVPESGSGCVCPEDVKSPVPLS